MILECIITTTGPTGLVNIAPMGATLQGDIILLRPFRETTTFANLLAGGAAVLNITDDAALFAYSALSTVLAPLLPAAGGRGAYLADGCAYWELEVANVDAAGERAVIECRVLARHRLRDFLGYNRARNAILEGTILATRAHLLPAGEIAGELDRLSVIVAKCGGEREREAMDYIRQYVMGRTA